MSELPSAALVVSDLDRSVEFYTKTLDFQLNHVDNQSRRAEIVDCTGDKFLLIMSASDDLHIILKPRHVVFYPGETLVFNGGDLSVADRSKLLVDRGVSDTKLTVKPWGDSVLVLTDPDGYVLKFAEQAELSLVQILELYLEGPLTLERLLANTSPGALDQVDSQSGWTARAIGHHVCDGDVLWAGALMAALTSSGTDYSHDWYTSDAACSENLSYDSRPLEAALNMFLAYRTMVAAMVTEISDAEERFVLFKRRYRDTSEVMKVKNILRSRCVHTLEHIEEMAMVMNSSSHSSTAS